MKTGNKIPSKLIIIALSLMTIMCTTQIKAQTTTITSQTNIATLVNGGEGTKENPYKISTIQQLKDLSTYVNAGGKTTFSNQIVGRGNNTYVAMYFSLQNDLDFNNTAFTSIGNNINPFQGRFYGNGHTISNIVIDQSTQDYIGLFGYISKEPNEGRQYLVQAPFQGDSASVEGLGLINATITGNTYVGGIVGYADKCEYIKDCYVTNSTITANSYVGGIAGYAQTNVYQGISYCYSNNNNISGTNYVAGIVGADYTTVKNCYSTSVVKNSSSSFGDWTYWKRGPIIGGDKENPATVANDCYYLANWNGTPNLNTDTTLHAKEVSSDSLKNTTFILNIMQNTDFSADVFNVNNGYPVLNGEVGGKVITITTKSIIPCNYNGAMPKSLIIAPGATLEDECNKLPDSVKVTIQSKLVVGHWNLIGSSIQKDSAGMLNNNKGLTSGLEHDIVASRFNYTNNLWYDNNQTYLYAKDALSVGAGYFVYPLTTAPQSLGGNAINPIDRYTVVSQIGNINKSDVITEDVKNTASVSPKYAILSNPYSADIDLIKFCKDNNMSIQGNTIYIYDPDYVNTKGEDCPRWLNNYDDGVSVLKRGQGIAVVLPIVSLSKNPNNKSLTECVFNFKKDQFVDQKTTTAKSNENMIKFIAKANYTSETIYTKIEDSASNGIDFNDAIAMFSTENTNLVEPYFIVDNYNLMKNDIKTLPYQCGINFRANEASNVDFYCENIPNDVEVSIVDTTTNEETSLNNANVFHFMANQGNNSDKYVVKIGKKNVGMENEANQEAISLSLYPNPAKESTTLTIDNLNNNAQVFLNDVQGRVINTYNVSKEQHTLKINTNNLTSGVYYIRVITNNSAKTEKLIVR